MRCSLESSDTVSTMVLWRLLLVAFWLRSIFESVGYYYSCDLHIFDDTGTGRFLSEFILIFNMTKNLEHQLHLTIFSCMVHRV